MKLLSVLGLGAFGLVLALSATPVRADQDLIDQVETLMAGLPPKDQAQRRSLTVRLANLYYSEALKVAADSIEDPKTQKTVAEYRRRATRLYEEFLTGNGGKYELPYGEQKEATRFQLARLYAEDDKAAEAKKIWTELAAQDEFPKVQSESALSLAELYEAENPASEEALKYYAIPAEADAKLDTRAYAHYRSAWILRNQQEFPKAIDELKAALYDSKGQVKDEVLRDLVVFYSLSDIGHEKAIAYFLDMQERLGRQDLLGELADAYIAAGNKPAAVGVLAEVSARKPDLVHQVRFLEESYGIRNWDSYADALKGLGKSTMDKVGDEDKVKVETILKRLTVQLDAERMTNTEAADEFVSTVDLFVRLFPKDETVFKMISGAVAVETDDEAKVAKIEAVLADKTLALKPEEHNLLREQLLSLHQKAGDHKAASAQAKILTESSAKPEDKRRFAFVQASELFDGGEEAAALPLLAALSTANAADDIGKKSQMLVVRTHGRNKSYGDAVKASATWLAAVGDNAEVKASKEYLAIVEVRDRAEFEGAVGMGDKPEALEVFKKNCLAGTFLPQSCENAKSLAIKLKNYDALIVLLKHEKNDEELAAVWEANGYFAEAATYYEGKKLAAKDVEMKDFLHVAILFEIAGQQAGRNRVLQALTKQIKATKFASGEEEGAYYAAMKDAQLVGPEILAMPWSDDMRCAIANDVATAKPGDDGATKALLACDKYAGEMWAQLVLDRVLKLDEAQAKIAFYGNGSKAKFTRRLGALKKLSAEVDKWLPGADSKTYLTLTGVAQKAYEKVALEVDQTPIPAEATEDMIPDIVEAIAEMSQPFKDKAAAYVKLADDEKAKAKDEVPAAAVAAVPPIPATVAVAAQATAEIQSSIKILNNDPENRGALTKILEMYKASGKPRIAAYFEGRINGLTGTH